MKNLILVLTLVCSYGITAVAGAGGCTPDSSLTQPGFYPSDGLPCAETGVYYDTTIYLLNFDTVDLADFGFPLGQAIVEWLEIDNGRGGIMGLPAGLNYACNPPTCRFDAGQPGCINIYGTTTAPTGNYPLTIAVNLRGSVPSQGIPPTTLPATSDDLPEDIIDLSIDVINPGDPCPLPLLTIEDEFFACNSQGATLTYDLDTGGMVPPLSYAWMPAINLNSPTLANPVASPTITTEYELTITDANNYSIKDTFIVQYDSTDVPVAAFSYEADSLNPLSLNFVNLSAAEGDVSYSWDFGNGFGAVSLNPGHVYSNAGTYDVTLTVTNNCGSDSETQTITVDTTNTGLSELDMALNGLDLFPNPNTGVFTIQGLVDTEVITAKVYDIAGRLIATKDVSGAISTGAQLSLGNAGSGMYFVRVTAGDSERVIKMIVE